jgi:ubiquinone/menaquinone biosynthesis C-methylase UbiE
MQKNNDIVKIHFTEDTYVKEMFDRNNLGFRDWEEIIVDKHFVRNKGNVLDIGCGTGRESIALTKLGYKVFGIDISEKEIKIAKEEAQNEKLEINYKLCNGMDLEFDDEYFDYSIIWAQTFGNIYTKKNRIKMLMENKRVLKKDGILCFSTHDYDFVKTNYKQYTKGKKFYPYSNSKCYWILFTIEEIIKEINETGLNIAFCGKSKELGNNIDIDVLVCVCRK